MGPRRLVIIKGGVVNCAKCYWGFKEQLLVGAKDWRPTGLATWSCLDTSGGDVSAEWRVGSRLKGMTRTLHGKGLKVAGRDDFFRNFALGETAKTVVARGACGCQEDGRFCNEAAGLGTGPVRKGRLIAAHRERVVNKFPERERSNGVACIGLRRVISGMGDVWPEA